MDASYLSFLRTNDFHCVFRCYYGVNANTVHNSKAFLLTVESNNMSLDQTAPGFGSYCLQYRESSSSSTEEIGHA